MWQASAKVSRLAPVLTYRRGSITQRRTSSSTQSGRLSRLGQDGNRRSTRAEVQRSGRRPQTIALPARLSWMIISEQRKTAAVGPPLSAHLLALSRSWVERAGPQVAELGAQNPACSLF